MFDGTCKCAEGYFYFTRALTCFFERGCVLGPLNEITEEYRPCPEESDACCGRCAPKCTVERLPLHFSYWDGETCLEHGDGLQALNKDAYHFLAHLDCG